MDYASKLLDLRWEHLPAEVQAQAKRCLKDILATAAGSLRLPNSDQTAELVAAEYGEGIVPMWFKGRGSSSTGAAYFNAQTIDSLDCHDGFRPNKGHCGATAVPVTLGACFGREGDLSGAEGFLRRTVEQDGQNVTALRALASWRAAACSASRWRPPPCSRSARCAASAPAASWS